MILNDRAVWVREVPQLESHEISLPHQRGSKPGSEPEKKHSTAAEMTAERLHSGVVNKAHRFSQCPRKIEMDPAFAQMLRVSENSSVAYRRRKTNRRKVEFPAPHGLLKFGDKLFWSHSRTRRKFAFYALRHEQFDEAAADIDDKNSSLHERARPREVGHFIARARTIAPCRSSVRVSQRCWQASTLQFEARRTGTAIPGQISNRTADFLQSVAPTGSH